MKLAEKEQKLYQTVVEFNTTVDQLLTEVNSRNDRRVVEEKKLYKASNAAKGTLSYLIFGGIAIAVFLVYKGLGIL